MLKAKVAESLKDALRKMGMGLHLDLLDIEVVVPAKEEYGDLSSNIAFVLSASTGKEPKEIGQQIMNKLDLTPFERVELMGPGFLNFFLKRQEILKVLAKIIEEGEGYGSAQLGKGEHVQIEFVSSNPTGPLTVGHGRQAALGDVLANLYENLGYKVTREYYYNDEGHQMEMLARSLWARYQQLLGIEEPIPEDGYQGEYLIELAKELVSEIGEKYKGQWDEETADYFKKRAIKAIMSQIEQDLKDFNIKFDVWYRESELYASSKVEKALQELIKKGAVYEKDGAMWLKVTKFGLPQDVVLRRRDGTFTYRMGDIAYQIDKYERGFDKVINIHGADHHAHVPVMLTAMEILGYPKNFLNYLLHQFVTLKVGEETKRMSTRAGEFVTLRELINELGTDVVRYFMIMRKPEQHLEFDYELAKKQSLENPAYYIQYAHTRIAGIFRELKAKDLKLKSWENISLEPLKEKEELALIKKLDEFPEMLQTAATNFAPHLLAAYTLELASLFHAFYDRFRVLGEDKELTEARLALVKGVQLVLKKSLDLLRITAPERM